MTNKTNNLVLAVLSLAVIVLYILHFSSGKPSQIADKQADNREIAQEDFDSPSESAEGEEEEGEISFRPAGAPLRIVYIDADVIIKKYDYYKKIRSEMEAKAMRSEQELEAEARKLEKEYMEAQQKAPSMSQEQLAMTEQTLMKKQQNVMMLRENLARELGEEEDKLDKLLRNKVQDYFKRLSKQEGYDYVLSYHYGSNVVYGDKMHDITKRVIDDLNREYAAEQQQKTKK
ncbi:MAG: OmpH family outer membrane protein [Bacteroidia bacterium]